MAIETREALVREVQRLAAKKILTEAEDLSFSTSIRQLEAMNATEGRGPRHAGDVRTAGRQETVDEALRLLETHGRSLAPFQQDHVDMLLRSRSSDADGAAIAKRLVTTENDAYRSAFHKQIMGDTVLTAAEQAAVLEFRAANEGTGSAGPFGIP